MNEEPDIVDTDEAKFIASHSFE